MAKVSKRTVKETVDVQGRAAAFITRIEGSYSGIMGLPLAETVALLAAFDIKSV